MNAEVAADTLAQTDSVLRQELAQQGADHAMTSAVFRATGSVQFILEFYGEEAARKVLSDLTAAVGDAITISKGSLN